MFKLCKPFWRRHKWFRYDELVEQWMVGGHYAWQRCSVCKKIKFDYCTEFSPAQEPDWKEHKKEVDRIMKFTPREYK